mmetsp:Transcript_31325/g.50315  ORF Transcript_31325/g.50315 Transcript_31325/m.50315 type:complete len:225 (-) Transcript_31325:5907-6581(-)
MERTSTFSRSSAMKTLPSSAGAVVNIAFERSRLATSPLLSNQGSTRRDMCASHMLRDCEFCKTDHLPLASSCLAPPRDSTMGVRWSRILPTSSGFLASNCCIACGGSMRIAMLSPMPPSGIFLSIPRSILRSLICLLIISISCPSSNPGSSARSSYSIWRSFMSCLSPCLTCGLAAYFIITSMGRPAFPPPVDLESPKLSGDSTAWSSIVVSSLDLRTSLVSVL